MNIYTGGSTLATSHFVTSLSGNLPSNPKPTFVSNNHLMIVVFSSDGVSNFQGFSARYYTSKLMIFFFLTLKVLVTTIDALGHF